MTQMGRASIAILATALAATASAAQANVRIFSYDPADAATQAAAGPLTFEFDQRLIFIKVLRVRSTQGQAAADLKPASEGALGPGGLTRLIGAQSHERDLYEVEAADQGADLIHAFCPGSTRAWMAFGKLAEDRDLTVRVLGDTPGGGPARLCRTFDFSFHGEWRVPEGRLPNYRPPIHRRSM